MTNISPLQPYQSETDEAVRALFKEEIFEHLSSLEENQINVWKCGKMTIKDTILALKDQNEVNLSFRKHPLKICYVYYCKTIRSDTYRSF